MPAFGPTASAPVGALASAPQEAQPAVRTVSLAIGDQAGPAANITGVKVSFAAGTGPHDAGPYLYQSSTEALDASGVLLFTLGLEAIGAGASGVLCVLFPDGRRMLRVVTVA